MAFNWATWSFAILKWAVVSTNWCVLSASWGCKFAIKSLSSLLSSSCWSVFLQELSCASISEYWEWVFRLSILKKRPMGRPILTIHNKWHLLMRPLLLVDVDGFVKTYDEMWNYNEMAHLKRKGLIICWFCILLASIFH